MADALADRLQVDLTAAMKARDELRTTTLRSAIAAVKEARVAGRADGKVVSAMVKRRLDT